jgi:hypothetical protein
MEKDLRRIMRELRAYNTVEVYFTRVRGELRLSTKGDDVNRIARYARNNRATFEEIADMIREDVAHEMAEQCRKH